MAKYIKVTKKAQDSEITINYLIEEILQYAHENLPNEEEGWSFYIVFNTDDYGIIGEVAIDMFDEAEVQDMDWEDIEDVIENYELKDPNQDIKWKRNNYGKSITATIDVKEKA